MRIDDFREEPQQHVRRDMIDREAIIDVLDSMPHDGLMTWVAVLISDVLTPSQIAGIADGYRDAYGEIGREWPSA